MKGKFKNKRSGQNFKKKKNKTNAELDKKINKVEQKILKTIELKESDTAITPIILPIITTAGSATVSNLSIVAVGTGQQQRIGDSVRVTSLRFSYGIYQSIYATTNIIPVFARVIVFRVMGIPVGTPAPSVVLSPAVNGYYTDAPYNMTNVGQWIKILYDKVHSLAPNGKDLMHVTKNIKLSYTLTYGDNLGTSAAQSGGLWAMAFAEAQGATNYPFYRFTSRMRYRDA